MVDPCKVVLDGAHNLLPEGAVHVLKRVQGECFRVMSVSDRRCFGSSGACWDDGCRSGIGRGHYPCCLEGRVDGGGEGESQVPKRAAAKVCVYGRRVRIEELVQGVDRVVSRFGANLWDRGVFEALDELIGRGGRHGGGGWGGG